MRSATILQIHFLSASRVSGCLLTISYDNKRIKTVMKLIRGDHGSFYNGVCASHISTNACQQSNGFAQVINTYSTAFFNLYLKKDTTAQTTLEQSNALLKIYEKKF